MSTLERAIEIAARAHAGQVDKAGAPYVLHPIRVMLRVQTVEQRIAAILHDVVEDTDVTLGDLRRKGFSLRVIAAVEALTRRSNEAYDDFVTRASKNAIAKRVKLADLEDNLDMSRLPHPSPRDLHRLKRYRRAKKRLSK
ncbi:MAG: HD domain-containing protein [Planctomycetota bacterium]|nr:HD domain-containing protein [Planctomycetota bacterium]